MDLEAGCWASWGLSQAMQGAPQRLYTAGGVLCVVAGSGDYPMGSMG